MHLLWQVRVYVCVIMYSMKYDAIPGTEPFSSQEASGRIVVKQAVPLLLKFAVIISCNKCCYQQKECSLYIFILVGMCFALVRSITHPATLQQSIHCPGVSDVHELFPFRSVGLRSKNHSSNIPAVL